MKRLKVFLLGGTRESIEIIKFVKEKYNSFILTTTTTEHGSKLAVEGGSDKTTSRPLPIDEIMDILDNSDFDVIVDATHPFATHITKTAIEVSKLCEIPYIRFERPTLDRKNLEYPNIYYVKSFEDAGKLIEKKFNKLNVLHFAGANTMKDVVKYVSPEKFYPRILEIESSFEKCEELGIEKSHIIPMRGTSTVEENIELIERIDGGLIITKESGKIGGLDSKINAAIEKDIPIIIIEKPEVEELDKNSIVTNFKELKEKLYAETGI